MNKETRNANLARVAFRLPEALDPIRKADPLSTRLELVKEIVVMAIEISNEAAKLPPEARMGALQDVCDLVTLAARNAAVLAAELEPLERLAEQNLPQGRRRIA